MYFVNKLLPKICVTTSQLLDVRVSYFTIQLLQNSVVIYTSDSFVTLTAVISKNKNNCQNWKLTYWIRRTFTFSILQSKFFSHTKLFGCRSVEFQWDFVRNSEHFQCHWCALDANRTAISKTCEIAYKTQVIVLDLISFDWTGKIDNENLRFCVRFSEFVCCCRFKVRPKGFL